MEKSELKDKQTSHTTRTLHLLYDLLRRITLIFMLRGNVAACFLKPNNIKTINWCYSCFPSATSSSSCFGCELFCSSPTILKIKDIRVKKKKRHLIILTIEHERNTDEFLVQIKQAHLSVKR